MTRKKEIPWTILKGIALIIMLGLLVFTEFWNGYYNNEIRKELQPLAQKGAEQFCKEQQYVVDKTLAVRQTIFYISENSTPEYVKEILKNTSAHCLEEEYVLENDNWCYDYRNFTTGRLLENGSIKCWIWWGKPKEECKDCNIYTGYNETHVFWTNENESKIITEREYSQIFNWNGENYE